MKEKEMRVLAWLQPWQRIPFSEFKKSLSTFKDDQIFSLTHLVRFSGCHKKKQEVGFDLLCRSVPRTDESCNQFLI
jgi:hypothetical protein